MFLRRGKKPGKIKFEFSAGGAVFKGNRQIEWLLIKPAKSDTWRLPKGNIEKGEKAEEAAIREVKEETGIDAQILEKIETIQYFYYFKKRRNLKKVTFFLMRYLKGEPSIESQFAHEIERVVWMTTKEALKSLSFKTEKDIISKAGEKLSKV